MNKSEALKQLVKRHAEVNTLSEQTAVESLKRDEVEMPDYEKMWRQTVAELEYHLEKNERLRGVKTELPTLRDQFAMAALPALMTQQNNVGWKFWAWRAYEVADNMLEAREKK